MGFLTYRPQPLNAWWDSPLVPCYMRVREWPRAGLEHAEKRKKIFSPTGNRSTDTYPLTPVVYLLYRFIWAGLSAVLKTNYFNSSCKRHKLFVSTVFKHLCWVSCILITPKHATVTSLRQSIEDLDWLMLSSRKTLRFGFFCEGNVWNNVNWPNYQTDRYFTAE